MALHYSQPFEALLERARSNSGDGGRLAPLSARVVIVGSGYGGSVAAYRLAELARSDGRQLHVVVLERGREYALGEFPTDLAELPAHLRIQRPDEPNAAGNHDALFDLHVGENVDVLVGSGLGGTSLINANVALEPDQDVIDRPPWPEALRAEARGDRRQPLWKAFAEVKNLLDVTTMPGHMSLGKYRTLDRYATALNLKCIAADIAVQFGTVENKVGVTQNACTGCGNCVTGCNVGAKNTLAMNLIPAAHARGVEFYTGALVRSVTPSGHDAGRPRWSLTVQATSRATRARCADELTLEADIVVLAAGTLGSTEILQRSVRLGLNLSPTLGRRFSTNGDALAMSFAGRDEVGAIGTVDYRQQHNCGPTITGVAREAPLNETKLTTRPLTDRFVLEDGAIPAGLLTLFGEIITSAAQAGRLVDDRLPGWFERDGSKKRDPLAVHPEAIRRSQVYLVMSHDDSSGQLSLATGRGSRTLDWIVPHWPTTKVGAPHTALDAIDACMRKPDRLDGLDGAQFVPNPLWRTLPRDADAVMSGRFLGGRLLSVHPLGGCAMADSGRFGVVNDVGQTYDGDAAGLHDGLHVLDASIIPTSLGVNPFLTIAALAWRACNSILQQHGIGFMRQPRPLQPLVATREPALEAAVDSPLVVRECLIGRLKPRGPGKLTKLKVLFPGVDVDRWCGKGGLILRLETDPTGSTTPGGPSIAPDAYRAALLRGEGVVPIKACLYRNTVGANDWKRLRAFSAPTAHLNRDSLVATGNGTMSILAPKPPRSWLTRWLRTWQAICAYLHWRQGLLGVVLREGRAAKRPPEEGARPPGLDRTRDGIRSFFAVARMHATYRDFEYKLVLGPPPPRRSPNPDPAEGPRARDGLASVPDDTPPLTPDWTLELQGRKRIAYRLGHRRLWRSLLKLPVRVSAYSRGQRIQRVRGRFSVDARYMVGEGLLRIRNAATGDLAQGLTDVVAYLGRFARCILQSAFWEFGAPDYPEPGNEPTRLPDPPEKIGSARRVTSTLHVQRFDRRNRSTVPLRLHRYTKESPPSDSRDPKIAVLIHGLAQGTLIYAHPKQPKSLTRYLLDEGYEVWLVDYRLSNQFDAGDVPYDGWTMDEIAKFDIPAAIQYLRKHYPPEATVHVFAHCVGAVAMTIAILKGWITNRDVQSLVLNAIHPWILPSPANDFRARLGVFVRDYLSDDFFDPIPATRDRVTTAQTVLDRLAFSLARLGETQRHPLGKDADLAQAICDRMSFLYGRMWEHKKSKNLHPCWKDLVGRAPGAVQRHLFYLLTRGRVLDRFGRNEYLKAENIRRNWTGIRTLFIHGDRSEVFNPQSASKAAFRLRRVLREGGDGRLSTPVGVKRVANFGHMDVIIGDDAEDESFRFIGRFFAGNYDEGLKGPDCPPPEDLDPPRDPHQKEYEDDGKLQVGPILRGARIDVDGKLRLRAWFGLPMYSTASSTHVRIKSPLVESCTTVDRWPRDDRRQPGHFFGTTQPQLLWADLVLAPDAYATIDADSPADGPGTERSAKVDCTRAASANRGSSPAVAGSSSIEQPKPSWLTRLLERQARRASGNGLTQPADNAHFLVGSCRYPGTPFDHDESDLVFGLMNRWLDRNLPCDGLFLIGDQIYADATAGILDPRSWRDRYVDRYRVSFTTGQSRKVLARLPVHFAVDDHEFADNFDGVKPRAHSDWRSCRHAGSFEDWRSRAVAAGIMGSREFRYAKRIARSYMGSARERAPFGNGKYAAGPLWYALEHGNEFPFPTFVLDTRSQRQRALPNAGARLINQRQRDALLGWLDDVSKGPWADTPKFIFSGSVIAPLCRDSHAPGAWLREDGWAGYPFDLEAVVARIVEKEIRHVVFVGGDLHLSCVAPLWLRDGSPRTVEALQIVASGLYAPLQFVNVSRSSFDWGHKQTIGAGACHIDYIAGLLSTSRSQFVQIAAEPAANGSGKWSITVMAHGVGDSGHPPQWTALI
jgi:cholesterol oxidase